jgi:glycosyltransferase involved in cell wall biosynthesis
VNARLTMVGCVPPPGISLPQYVTTIGKIDKAKEVEQNVLTALYMQSRFLILPSRAESAAVSLAEASSHGVPSVSTDVGGNSSLVKNGVNGPLFPLEAPGADYVNYALQLLGDECIYSEICWSSFKRYQSELNWDVAASRLMREISVELQLAGGQYACSPAK